MSAWLDKTHLGDCRSLMKRMIADGVKVNCVVTSPPYWGLRDYNIAGQFGLERSWVRHVARMRGVFRIVRELLEEDGTLWLNYGDSYASDGGPGWQGKNGQRSARRFTLQRDSVAMRQCRRSARDGLKPKDLVGMPWRVALALQASGWWLRSDVIWSKPNPMPESIKDRPTKAHEYLFLLAKSQRYYYNADAARGPSTGGAHPRGAGLHRKVAGWADGPGSHSAKDHARRAQGLRDSTKFGRGPGWRNKQNCSFSAAVTDTVNDRNLRTVWTIPTEKFPGPHFATFPRNLVALCILAGTRPGDVVLDPFMGSGTVAQVAVDLGRHFIGCELSAEYLALHRMRATTQGMPL